MLTPMQIKEDVECVCHMFLVDEEDPLFEVVRRKSRRDFCFLICQTSDHLCEMFEVEDLGCEAKTLVRGDKPFCSAPRKGSGQLFSL